MTNAARARMESWKASLLDLSIDNPLIDAFGLELTAEPIALAAALAAGGGLAIEAGIGALADGKLSAQLAPAELQRELVALRREAASSSGEHALWIALGTLTWSDGGDRTRRAPLALWPVELDQGRLASAVEPGWLEPQVNPVLVEKLRRDFDLVLAGTVAQLATLFEAAESIALTRPGWKVERTALLGCFAPAQAALWRDLDGREDALLAHPLVSQLALGGVLAQPSGAAASAVTGRPGSAELGNLLAPLDADATQLQAVAAAGLGATFVLQAPPGTGATQTIANLIAHCTGSGKSVLLVSDKPAAIDAIRERLASVGLGDLVLALTSRAGGGSLAASGGALAQLERVLSRAFRPHAPQLQDHGTRLDELRAVLDGHATSLHKVGVFGRSLHEVLGRLVELRTTPRAALAEMDAVGLDAATFTRRRDAVERLAAAAVRVDPVTSHPWRASTLTTASFGPDGRERALRAIDEAAAAATAVDSSRTAVGHLIPNLVARSKEQLLALGALGTLAATSPRPGAELLTASRARASEQLDEQIALIRARGGERTSIETPRDPHAFLQLARRHRALAEEVRDRFTDAVDGIDAAGLWSQLKKWTHSMAPVRFVALRTARAEVKAVAQPLQLETDASMIEALESVIAERACRAALEAAAEPARRWFGDLGGAALKLDLEAIDDASKWGSELRTAFDAIELVGGEKEREAAWRALVAHVAAGPGDDVAIEVLARLGREVARWAGTLDELTLATGIPYRHDGDHVAKLVEQTATLRHAIDQLVDWVTFHDARHQALASGVGPAVAAIERGDLAAAELAPAWERATLLAWADAELAETQVAEGASHHAHVAAFADLDRAALAMVRSRALVRFAERVPAVPPGKLDPDTELGALLTELRAAGRRVGAPGDGPTPSVREMFAGIPLVLPRIAPCIAATPAALAQYLDPSLTFDVVVFDQASQLPTAAAIGALSRAASAVIVGDSQLLPPFAMVRQDRSVEADGLLADALAARLPELRLGWHYRARHEDVVAYANERFYGDRLQLFPAMQASSELGLVARPIGRAPELVAELLARLRDPANPGRSLGLVTFSRALRDQVLDLIDDVRRDEPLLDALTEPLAIEHVIDAQQLSRDVVLVAFDDLPLEPRRLCVALTRAREQLVLCTGLVTAPTGELAALLARAGGSQAPSHAPANPITEAIARALADRGWAVRHQVGSGGYKIDLAVLDPADPDRYVLAIETDGGAYASAPIARDRDRLRAQVLTQLGWRLHRIWSLDWWANPDYEIQRAHASIVTAIAATRRRSVPAPTIKRAARTSRTIATEQTQPHAPVPVAVAAAPSNRIVAREASGPISEIPETLKTMPTLAAGSAPIKIAKNQIPIGPYVAAAIPPGRRTPDDLFAPRHLPELKKVIEQVLAAEAPMHVDLLARRVGAYFGVGRVTPRVTDQIRAVLEGRGKLGDEQDIVWRLDQDPASVPAVRVAGSSGGSVTGRREIIEIPLAELAAAARIIVERSSSIGTQDLVRDAARLIGFARITPQVSERVAEGVRLAQIRELIRIDAGKARMPD